MYIPFAYTYSKFWVSASFKTPLDSYFFVSESTVCEKIYDSSCDSSYTKYGYSMEDKKCTEFFYHGCLGNHNNYDEMTECEAKNSKFDNERRNSAYTLVTDF